MSLSLVSLKMVEPPFVQEGSLIGSQVPPSPILAGPPMVSPWRRILNQNPGPHALFVPTPPEEMQVFPPAIYFGPPFASPWRKPLNQIPLPPIPNFPVAEPDRQVSMPPVLVGPPLPGAPWRKIRLPWLNQNHALFVQPAAGFPFVERVPDVRTQVGQDRLRRMTEKLSIIINSLLRQGYLHQVGGSDTYAVIGGAFSATRAPNAMDDSTIGVVVGAPWVNTATGQIYFCTSNLTGLATWAGPV